MKQEKNLWQKTRMELLRDLACSDAGLTAAEAGKRLAKFGPNELQAVSYTHLTLPTMRTV